MTRLFDPKPDLARPDGCVPYHYDGELDIAINAALGADRPLLLRGNPGSGKTTLARDVAFCLGRRYDAEVITSRTQAQDLQWRFDAVRRLADAQVRGGRALGGDRDATYVKPGVLWRAFDPEDAARHGQQPADSSRTRGRARAGRAQATVDRRDAVVLLDEIDKADPDVPNDLLSILEERTFRIVETGHVVRQRDGLAIFLVLTTNRERELPGAFMRRCVVFDIEDPGPDTMKTIARLHHRDPKRPGLALPAAEALLDPIWGALVEWRQRADGARLRAPTTAEYLDALNACLKLNIEGERDPRWRRVVEATMWKHPPSGKG